MRNARPVSKTCWPSSTASVSNAGTDFVACGCDIIFYRKLQNVTNLHRLKFKAISTALVLLVLTSLFSFTSASCSGISAKTTIGAFISLSGNLAVYGESQQRGIELAVSEINSSGFLGDGHKIEVVFEDAVATRDSAIAACNSLIGQGVAGLIGPTLSSQAFGADPVAQENKIPVIAISNTVSGITEMGNFIFRCSLPESSVIDGTVKTAAASYSIQKVGILWAAEDAVTVAGREAFIAAMDKYGIEIQTDQSFKAGDTDFRIQLSEIIAAEPDAICVLALQTEAIQIVLQARELGFTGYILGGNGFNTPDIITGAGESAEKIIVGTAWNKQNQDATNTNFISAYEALYGSAPDQFAAQSYTAVWLFAQAILSAGSSDAAAIRDALADISDFATPLGHFSFTNDREPLHPSAVQIVENGKFVIIG
jgi:branched-chain amino acid transport system substrate-binding protein